MRRKEDGRALETSVPKCLEGDVRVVQRVGVDPGLDRNSRGQVKEFGPVGTRQVGDRFDGPLFPEQVVRECRDLRHVDAGTDDDARFVDRL